MRCPECGTTRHDPRQASEPCPSCGAPPARPSGDAPAVDTTPVLDEADLVVVAQAANMAEAGYFQSVLADRGVPSQLEPQGPGPVSLSVPQDHTGRATALLSYEAGEHGLSEVPESEFRYPRSGESEESEPGRFWAAVVVACLVALVAHLLMKQLTDVPVRPRRPAGPEDVRLPRPIGERVPAAAGRPMRSGPFGKQCRQQQHADGDLDRAGHLQDPWADGAQQGLDAAREEGQQHALEHQQIHHDDQHNFHHGRVSGQTRVG